MKDQVKQAKLREKRKLRVRSKVAGTAARPRLSVFRSAKHVYVQAIDDTSGRTVCSASSFQKGNKGSATVAGCEEVGRRIAAACQEQGIKQIVFDKNGNKYHGRVKAVASGCREAGLQF